MKNALILHGTNGNSKENWFPWLEKELKAKGKNVWTPDLPGSDNPNISVYNKLILSQWEFNNESVIIGHSSGAVAALGLLQELPKNITIDRVFLVAGFTHDLGWEQLKGMFTKDFDWKKIRKKAKNFILYHSDNDPYVSIDHGERLKEYLQAELIVKPGFGHFNMGTSPQFTQFPELLEKI